MAVRAAQILHDVNGFVVDRIQSGGVSNVGIPEEQVYELGNNQTVATVRDTPDLSFDIESLDVSTEIEQILTGTTGTPSSGAEFDLLDAMPFDVISPFKSALNAYDIVKGIVVPYLTLESATYRFGVGSNSTQSFSARGDSIYYIPGTPVYQEFTLVNNTLTYALGNTALLYSYSGDSIYVLGACVKNPTTKAYRRLVYGSDYTNTANSITTIADWFDSGYTKLHVVYGSATAGSYPQNVHQGTTVKPAAVRGKDIDVYVGSNDATPTLGRWSGVQSFEVTRRVALEADREFGNAQNVSYDYDVPEVTGTIELKPADADDLFDKIQQIANVDSASEVIGPHTSQALPLEVRISDPDTGSVVKTLYVPDARFTVPAVQGRVQTKLTTTFSWRSDGGTLLVYKNARP